MRPTLLSTGLALTALACGSEPSPTEPATTASLAANTWTQLGPHQLGTVVGVSYGILPNAAGQSIVYSMGGCDVVQGDGTSCTVSDIKTYHSATGVWSSDEAFQAAVWQGNGIGAIGNKITSREGIPPTTGWMGCRAASGPTSLRRGK